MDKTLITITVVFSIVVGGLASCPSYCYPPHQVPFLGWDCTDCPPNVPTCPCYLPKVVGPCRGAFPRFYFNSETGICESFIYGGCGGNDNNYETKLECEQACTNVCALPIDSGTSCSPRPIGRFGYSKEEGQCVKFQYGGCGGNSNSFQTVDQCEQTCEN